MKLERTKSYILQNTVKYVKLILLLSYQIELENKIQEIQWNKIVFESGHINQNAVPNKARMIIAPRCY